MNGVEMDSKQQEQEIFFVMPFHSLYYCIAGMEQFLVTSKFKIFPSVFAKISSNGPSHPGASRLPPFSRSLLDIATFPVAKNAAELSCKNPNCLSLKKTQAEIKSKERNLALYHRTHAK